MSSGRWRGWSGKKDGKGNKSAACGGQTEKWRDWGRKVVKQNAALKREIQHFREGGGEELFIPRFGCIPGCLALIQMASVFFLVLPPDWLDPRAVFSLPDPKLSKLHHGTTRCLRLTGKRAKVRYTCVASASLLPSPVRQKASL